ncbi:DUF58 domain-containing protein [Rufibacter glacialis]|uniref:DUF58 domain-containing protein n=1 Tax=Rufibacter glacialis TaxID=1259555 RepID=A0A5M8Q554_9BACT|nr:DUF58 domain-containing protein [Rufibacter glacialis]KAA6430969.1 DUF58 domain-containing protein [Rufibacter glacialis]GGK82930.1 hypothetical protein GCM10011405_33440 [Rufibacter glacialis]
MPHRLLNPQTFAAIKDLRLIAKAVVDGFLLGQNQSIRRGPGIEFAQYRSYQPGDDLRQLDWKMFARSDRYYIRESEVDSSVAVRFVVDASGSMAHQDGTLAKLDYARYLVAALAYLATQQGDAVGLFVLQEDQLVPLAPGQSTQHLQRLFHQLDQVKPGGQFPAADCLAPVFAKKRQKELTVLVTDMYEQTSEITDTLRKIGAREKDTLLFHLMGQNELEFNYQGPVSFQDLETGQTIQVSSETQRTEYLQNLHQWLQALETDARKKQIHYERFHLHEPLDKALRAFLLSRAKQ